MTEVELTPEQWEAIAEYVKSVARQAYSFGFSDGFFWRDPEKPGDVDYRLRTKNANIYVGGDAFSVEMLKRYHPLGKES